METTIAIRINNNLKKALMKLAEQDRRNLSDWLRIQLENLVEQSKPKK